MRPEVVVGNDVVDLADPRTGGQSKKVRFLERVFTAAERAGIANADDPDLELWCCWAAKEAGFKVASKLLGEPPVFAHRAFEVEWVAPARDGSDAPLQDPIRVGSVRCDLVGTAAEGDGAVPVVPVAVRVHGDTLHAVAHAALPPRPRRPTIAERVAHLESPDSVWTGTLEALLTRFTDREADAVYSRESAAVRLGARSVLSDALDVPEERVEIVCAPGPPGRRPPQVLVDGVPGLADVSLSHDGPWIAWAIWCG